MAQQTNILDLRDAPRVPGVHTDDGHAHPARRPVAHGFVHSKEAGGAVDGPGIRYVLFVSGCPLRCQYCHNPDTWHMRKGKETSVGEIIAEIASYSNFLKRAKGGITITGGEPLTQVEFTAEIFHAAKAMGLHTALDTSGFLGKRVSDEMLEDIDLVLLDIKAFTEETYFEVTGAQLQPTLDFARRLSAMGKKIWLRYVLVPGLTDKLDEIEGLAAFRRRTRRGRAGGCAALPQARRIQVEGMWPANTNWPIPSHRRANSSSGCARFSGATA